MCVCRLFPTKAVAVWLPLSDLGRLGLIGDYFHYSRAGFGAPRAFGITAVTADDPTFENREASYRDLMFIVEATKEEACAA